MPTQMPHRNYNELQRPYLTMNLAGYRVLAPISHARPYLYRAAGHNKRELNKLDGYGRGPFMKCHSSCERQVDRHRPQ
jgi:hypothetical protein